MLELAMRVETARGAMAVDGLGTTLMHEHVFVLTPDVEWILRAVGQTHVGRRPQDRPDRAADPQGGGRRPDEGRIGHCGDTTDLDYLREIANAGSVLGMDPFGIDAFLPFEDRVTTVVALAKAGYADWMVLAHDASCYSDFYSESYKTVLLPRWNYTHITDDVLPALREYSVDEAQITAMLVHNPARYFTGGQE